MENHELLQKKIKDSKYVLIPGKMEPSHPYFELYKNVYHLWKTTWKKVFGDVGSPDHFSPDDFYRQDIIPVICYEDEPIAAHFYTLFHMENPAALDHHYFDIFPEESLMKLQQSQSKRLMSMEYLTVAPGFRKSVMGFSLAEVIGTLGVRLLKEIHYDAALGVAVKAATVDKMATKVGFDFLGRNVGRGNLVCDIVIKHLDTVRAPFHPDHKTDEYIQNLWAHRESTAMFDQFPIQTKQGLGSPNNRPVLRKYQ